MSPPCTANGPVTVPTGGTVTPQTVAQAALTAYNCMWHEMQNAALTADWQDPALARYASGNALTMLVHGLYTDHTQGVIAKGSLILHPQVIAVLPPNAAPLEVEIADCVDDSHWVNYLAATPTQRQSGTGSGLHPTQAIATVANGVWTVSKLAVSPAETGNPAPSAPTVGTC